MEERQKKVKQDKWLIQEVEVLCVRAYGTDSETWEALMDDVELQDVRKIIHVEETILVALQTSLKSLAPVENISKDDKIKVLHQQVSKLWT